MSGLHVKYLLIGGGVTASEAAVQIRRLDPRGDLLLVGQEISRPYRRPPLSRDFLLGPAHEDLFTLSSEWFVEHDVLLRTGKRAAHLDVNRRAAILDTAEEISYDKLLLATGGGPRALNVPGADLPNHFYLRTLADAHQLFHAIEKARREGRGRAVVIGGGMLGLELAGTLTRAGLKIELAVSGKHPWDHLAGETTGKCLSRYLESQGVVVHADDRAAALEGDGRVQRVALASGKTVQCDFAVSAVGLDVHKELLRGSPIDAERAILVNERCMTSVPDIYAAGDCAAIFDPLFGKHRLLQQWESAAETGRIAGINMAGGDAWFDSVSHFESRIADLTVNVWGDARFVDRRVVRGVTTPETPSFVEFGVGANGRISQVIAVGPMRDGATPSEMVRRRVNVQGIEEQLKDPATSLGKLLDL